MLRSIGEILDEWMQRADWLRGAAQTRVAEAATHPPHSDEHRKQLEIAADLERRAKAAGRIA